jgi:hypothetical protein
MEDRSEEKGVQGFNLGTIHGKRMRNKEILILKGQKGTISDEGGKLRVLYPGN